MVTQMRDGTVDFRFLRPRAHNVALTGEFNGWHPSSLPMHKSLDGWWHYHLHLSPGCYRFRYLADGIWYTDYAAFGIEHNPLGVNSVVKVDPPAEQVDQPAQAPVLKLRSAGNIHPQPEYEPVAEKCKEMLVSAAG